MSGLAIRSWVIVFTGVGISLGPIIVYEKALVSDLSEQLDDLNKRHAIREAEHAMTVEELNRIHAERVAERRKKSKKIEDHLNDRILAATQDVATLQQHIRRQADSLDASRRENTDLRESLASERKVLHEVRTKLSTCGKDKYAVLTDLATLEKQVNVSHSESIDLRRRLSADGRLLQEALLNFSFCEKDKAAFLEELETLERHVNDVDNARSCCEQVPMCNLCAMKKSTNSQGMMRHMH